MLNLKYYQDCEQFNSFAASAQTKVKGTPPIAEQVFKVN